MKPGRAKIVDRVSAVSNYSSSVHRRLRALATALLLLSSFAFIASLASSVVRGASRAGVVLQQSDLAWSLVFYAATAMASIVYTVVARGCPFTALWWKPAGEALGRKDATRVAMFRLANWAIAGSGFWALLTVLHLLAP